MTDFDNVAFDRDDVPTEVVDRDVVVDDDTEADDALEE